MTARSCQDDGCASAGPGRAPARQRALTGLLLAGVLALAGCSSFSSFSFWPWGSTVKIPDPPAVTAPVAARQAWSTRLGPAGLGFAPVFAAGSVFAASSDGAVARIDAETGRVAWRVDAGKRLSSGVGSDGDTTVVAARDGSLIAFDGQGRQRWSAQLGGEAVTVPAVGMGLVVVRASDNRLTAFEADTGKRRWSFQRQNPSLVLRQTAGVAIAPDAVYAGMPGGRLVSLSLQTGALRWEGTVSQPKGATEIERIADVVGSPLVSGRTVCAASFQGKVACFDTQSGRPQWSRDVSSSAGIDIDASLLAVVDDRDHVHAFSRSGASLWRQEGLSGRGVSAPLSLGPVLVLGDSLGLVYLLSRSDGAVAGRFATDGSALVSPPVAAGRTAVVQTSAGALVGISLD
ncbi:MAG TPA: outer membrane protein assembly factor BamB [Quisquiliibacterium sp.]|nr:outer membrane protein assembly factor BamB [Quisquiliibacterium sp.]